MSLIALNARSRRKMRSLGDQSRHRPNPASAAAAGSLPRSRGPDARPSAKCDLLPGASSTGGSTARAPDSRRPSGSVRAFESSLDELRSAAKARWRSTYLALSLAKASCRLEGRWFGATRVAVDSTSRMRLTNDRLTNGSRAPVSSTRQCPGTSAHAPQQLPGFEQVVLAVTEQDVVCHRRARRASARLSLKPGMP